MICKVHLILIGARRLSDIDYQLASKIVSFGTIHWSFHCILKQIYSTKKKRYLHSQTYDAHLGISYPYTFPCRVLKKKERIKLLKLEHLSHVFLSCFLFAIYLGIFFNSNMYHVPTSQTFRINKPKSSPCARQQTKFVTLKSEPSHYPIQVYCTCYNVCLKLALLSKV